MKVREFETGAIRDYKEIPTRWDLISLIALQRVADQCRDHEFNNWKINSPLTLVGFSIQALMTWMSGDRDRSYLPIAFRQLAYAAQIHELSLEQRAEVDLRWHEIGSQCTGSTCLEFIPHAALRHLASTLEEGRIKYAEWNWLYGFPIQNTISHALDHMFALSSGVWNEDHFGHALWNIMVSIHTEQTRPDLMQLLPAQEYQITDELREHHAKFRAQREAELGKQRMDECSAAPPPGPSNRSRVKGHVGGSGYFFAPGGVDPDGMPVHNEQNYPNGRCAVVPITIEQIFERGVGTLRKN